MSVIAVAIGGRGFVPFDPGAGGDTSPGLIPRRYGTEYLLHTEKCFVYFFVKRKKTRLGMSKAKQAMAKSTGANGRARCCVAETHSDKRQATSDRRRDAGPRFPGICVMRATRANSSGLGIRGGARLGPDRFGENSFRYYVEGPVNNKPRCRAAFLYERRTKPASSAIDVIVQSLRRALQCNLQPKLKRGRGVAAA